MSFPPLTGLISRQGWRDDCDRGVTTTYHDCAELVDREADLREPKLPSLEVQQHAPMLFGPLARSYIVHLFKTHPKFKVRKHDKPGWVYGKDLPSWMRMSLLTRLHWFKRLKVPVRDKMFEMVRTEEGWKALRGIFVSCEMRMNAVILADPSRSYEEFDRINCSLISNSLYRRDYHSALKGVIKKARKGIFSGNSFVVPREFSWLQETLNRVKDRVDSRIRQLTLLQTRASGLPDKEQKEKSVKEWIDLVTDQPDSDVELLAEVSGLESYIRETMVVNKSTVTHTHVSLGSAACREQSRKNGGKTAFARNLFNSIDVVNRLDLATGEPTEEVIDKREKTGDWLLHHSLMRMKDGYDCLSVKTSAIPEVGQKARIITVPSFFSSTILSPWAHLTYHFLATSRECRSGVRGSNQGWELSLAMSASDPDLYWLFHNEELPRCVNSDLKTATDAAYFKAVSIILDVVQAVMPVPEWYFNQIKTLLTSERPFSAKFESQIITGTTRRGLFMGDHGSKTILTLSGIAALANMPSPRLSRIVGDDHITTTPDPERCLDTYRKKLENLGYIISEDDTFISNDGYLAEEAFKIPSDGDLTTETFTFAKQKRDLPYFDYPKVKILTDQGTDIGGFSDKIVGKIQLLGKRMGYSSGTFTEARFHLASWIQDLCITALYRPEFIYFPFHLVGAGKPVLFNNSSNFKRFVKMHRHGRLTPYYADIMAKSLQREPLEPNRYVVSGFLDHQGTDFVKVIEREFDEELFSPFAVFTSPTLSRMSPFIVGRLGRKIISETEIMQKLNEMEDLFGDPPETVRLTVKSLAREGELTDELLETFVTSWRRNDHNLSLRRDEKYYEREPVELILGREHPMRVSGLTDLLPDGRPPNPDNQLERDREVNMLFEWIRTNPEGLDGIPMALVRDDEIKLLQKEHLDPPRLLFVSDDIDFGRRIATQRASSWRDPKRTYRISIVNWIRAGLKPNEDFDACTQVYVDQGSLDGYLGDEANYTETDEALDFSDANQAKLGTPEYRDIIHLCKQSIAPSGNTFTEELRNLMRD